MTQPLDVAYVEIRPDLKDFSREADRQVDKSLKSVEQRADDTSKRLENTFKETAERIGDLFKGADGNLRNAKGQFASLGKSATDALSGIGDAATTAGRGLSQVGGLLTGLLGGLGQLAATGPVGLAILAAAFIALAGAVTVAAAAVQGLLTITSFAVALLPGLIAGAIAGFGILAVALNGVSEAFQEQTESANAAGGAAVNNARQIADAQRGVLEAQRNLIKAREEELERIQDVRRELIAARTAEKRAADNVLKAEFALQEARRTGTPRAVIEAQLALEEANAALDASKDKTEDLAKEKAKSDKVGVEGSERVLAAQEQLRDAQDRLAATQQKISAGVAASTKAFDGLTKSAQAFVSQLVIAKERLGPLADAIQEAFFSGSAPLIQPIVDNLLELQPAFTRVADAFGNIFDEVLKFLGGDVAKKALDDLLGGLADFLETITPAIGPLLEAFAGLVGQSGDFGDNLGVLVRDGLLKVADFVKNVDLKQLFEDAKKAVKELTPLVIPLLSSLKDLFDILVPLGKVAIPFVAQGFKTMADAIAIADQIFTPIFDKIDKFLKLLQTDPKLAFEVFKAAVKTGIDSAIKKFDEFLIKVSENIEKVKSFLRNLPQTLITFGPKFLSAGKSLITKFFEGLGAASGFLADVGKKIANSFIRFINRSVIGGLNDGIRSIENALNRLPLFDVDLPNIPNIPQFEKGGLALGNMLANIGEGGKKEAVLPLESPRAMQAVGSAIANAGGTGGSGQITFESGAVVVNFSGVVPTEAEAFRTGQAVGNGIADRLARRNLKTAVRVL